MSPSLQVLAFTLLGPPAAAAAWGILLLIFGASRKQVLDWLLEKAERPSLIDLLRALRGLPQAGKDDEDKKKQDDGDDPPP
ncbi:hypothetical protein [Pseudonocardia sp. TRM90224]|uniref:hypothetical protein n=1 Tax=Pseudonocardia sp. TRM90224 TaxID=2812678 RepID=UPI001E3C82C4|nr:hypothetical protein [Pseudonocardia sp. TRM90224]